MDINLVKPWEGEDAIYLMPLVENIPRHGRDGWERTNCPICGEECWKTTLGKKFEKETGAKGMCTMCGLKHRRHRERGERDE